MVEDKNTNENTEANDVRPKRIGIRHFKDYFNSVFHLNQSFRYYKEESKEHVVVFIYNIPRQLLPNKE